jgi:hypothetical protein
LAVGLSLSFTESPMRILRGLRLKVLALGGLTVVAFLAGFVGTEKPAVGQTFEWLVCNVCSDNALRDPLCEDCRERVFKILRPCRLNWDASCMSEARRLCGGVACTCPHSVCQYGEFLDEFCDGASPPGCVQAVGLHDTFCRGILWDHVCIKHAREICGAACP